MSEINQSTLTEIHHCIRQCMLEPDDFSVDLIEEQQGHIILEIKYKPNGTAKRYKQGAGCEFPIDFCFDVSSGIFGAN
jgi:hypothetical protein